MQLNAQENLPTPFRKYKHVVCVVVFPLLPRHVIGQNIVSVLPRVGQPVYRPCAHC